MRKSKIVGSKCFLDIPRNYDNSLDIRCIWFSAFSIEKALFARYDCIKTIVIFIGHFWPKIIRKVFQIASRRLDVLESKFSKWSHPSDLHQGEQRTPWTLIVMDAPFGRVLFASKVGRSIRAYTHPKPVLLRHKPGGFLRLICKQSSASNANVILTWSMHPSKVPEFKSE